MTTTDSSGRNGDGVDVDVVVVGAGMAGLYLIHKLRSLGFSVLTLEAADDVGGTWYWNRYPGARCDIQSIDYSYTFDPELDAEWTWSEKYATQPEILRYLQHVADRFDLRRDIRFCTRVESAVWDDAGSRWTITTDAGDAVACRYYVMASGCLSMPKTPDIEGADRFQGDVYFTSRWPHEGVDLTGKRVAVIGTGSSGIQSIPLIAQQASELTVFQRTPNFSMPAFNGAVPPNRVAELERDRAAYRDAARWSRGGVPVELAQVGALQVSDEERRKKYDEVWSLGELMAPLGSYNDLLVNPAANETFAEYIRERIREMVHDPETAEALCPRDHPFGTKRPCLDTGYYQTFNLPHVRLVDLRKDPITTITETGVETSSGSFEVDVIVYATGFDAMTGAIVAVDITGRDGATLRQVWEHGPTTYLGLMTKGFPNLFMVTGPGSPSVLSNMAVSIEQHVDWIAQCLADQREQGFEVIEPTEVAEAGWDQHVQDCAGITLYPQANSWYMGANVPGKPRVFLPYVGGVDAYRQICNEVAEQDYLGFRRRGPEGERCVDGVVRRLQPDAALVLQIMADLGLPPLESMPVADAREFMVAAAAQRPPGPEVGEIVDGELPGAEEPLAYRLYRPASPGPHPVVVYYHGGGWVLGSADSDDPFCRYLCDASDALVISVNYRHAPEHRFPAAAEDGFAALQWIAEHAAELGGDPDRLVVVGWSAGGNVAAVTAQRARDAGGPRLAGQVLINPVTDYDPSRPSFEENADGFGLTRAMMDWFWDHYTDPEDRTDPRAAPLRAADLSGLPPALVVTAEFDPLRDEGAAYAEALSAAGVDTRHLPLRGQVHTSVTSVDVIISANEARARIAEAIREMAGVTVAG